MPSTFALRLPGRYTPVRRWQPLSDAEWAALAPHVARAEGAAGRPLPGARARMDAIFWVATAGCPWSGLPPRWGRPDTVGRHFRRLAHAGVWEALLRALADPRCPAPLRAAEHYLVRAARRATRLRGLRIVMLAKRLGLPSALRGPGWMLPDTDLSELAFARTDHLLEPLYAGRWEANTPALRRTLRLLRGLLRLAGGCARIPRCLEPA